MKKDNLKSLSLQELHKGYGAGEATPGAGTAAAETSMISAQLALTVIKKTVCKEDYSHVHDKLNYFAKEITNRILPRLENLFQLDSDKFQKHMDVRVEAKNEKDSELRARLKKEACELLIPCTEIPLEIAFLSKELCDITIYLVDYAFSAVRGDASVALNSAHSAIGGCVSIIDLNLMYFESNDWSKTIEYSSSELTEYFNYISKEIRKRQASQKDERYWKLEGLFDFRKAFLNQLEDTSLDFEDIEKVVSEMQNTMWKYKKAIWINDTPENPIQAIDPLKALSLLGYQYETRTTLGQYFAKGKEVETAGVTDKNYKIVAISEQFPPQTRYFTLCHELGHVVLHKKQRIYRDGPVEGSFSNNGQNWEEKQANNFATCFSMPKNIVISEFTRIYKTTKLVIDEDTMFRLNQGTVSNFRKKHRTLRDFSLFIAGTERYNDESFLSISKLFGVSKKAMAIRLEELELLEF